MLVSDAEALSSLTALKNEITAHDGVGERAIFAAMHSCNVTKSLLRLQIVYGWHQAHQRVFNAMESLLQPTHLRLCFSVLYLECKPPVVWKPMWIFRKC